VEKAAEPLSKSQQEEAAKLAERRKKFDNQRYHGGGAPLQSSERNQASAQGSTMPDMMFGLNQAHVKNEQSQQHSCFMDLPGGILDDLEQVPHANANSKKVNSHDDVESTGIDAEDEKLMAELMEELDI